MTGPQAIEALSDLARQSAQPPTPVELDQGLQALSARIAAGKARRTGLLRWSFVGATAVASVAVVFGIVAGSRRSSPQPAPPPLAYRIEGGNVVAGGYLRESGRTGIKMFFSEGTELVLMSGTHGRLRAVDSAGARIAIEQGTASFQVTPRREAKWLVDVGPFLVTVTGTVFTVSWDAARERFELRLRHGRVSVSGPISGGDIALRAGQRLVVNLPKAETTITEQNPEDAWGEGPVVPAPSGMSPPGERPSVASERTAGRGGAQASSSPFVANIDGDRRWPEALAAGQLDRILDEVTRVGLKATLEKASSEDLFALATAARYRRRVVLARAALLAERRRFPSSDRALDAAFLLGRIEEASDGGASRAVKWYDAYLARAPTGTYASEALGRKMIVTSKLEGRERGQSLAEEYLRRFPRGSYAGSARALRRAP
jgi:TolA-binding protein